MPSAVPLFRQPFGIYDLPRTDSGQPPSKNPPPRQYGNYCFRAQAEVVDETDNELMKIIGYDQDFGISDKVQEVCKVHEGRGHGKCTAVKLAFIGSHPKCDGTINVETNEP